MVNIVKPKNSYTPKNGNIDIYGDYHEYVEEINWKDFLTMNPMPIDVISLNPWKALGDIGVDHIDIENLKEWSKNYCPCSYMEYYAIIPIAILTFDATQYYKDRKLWSYNMLNDADWNRQQNWGISDKKIPYQIPEKHLNSIHRAILGSGYNECILPYDGGHSLIFATIPLDNGDKVVIIGWEWYNK